MSKNVLQTIRSRTDSFSRGQKRIADYILMNYDKAAFMTAGHLGRKAQVSESTVVRFASQLGYDGYPNMQRALQELVRGKLTSLQRIQVSRDQMQEQDVLTGVMQRDMNSIHTAIESVDRAAFDQVVDRLLTASHIYLMGVRSSAFLAGYLNFYLHLMFKNVTLVQNAAAGEIFEQLSQIGPRGCAGGHQLPPVLPDGHPRRGVCPGPGRRRGGHHRRADVAPLPDGHGVAAGAQRHDLLCGLHGCSPEPAERTDRGGGAAEKRGSIRHLLPAGECLVQIQHIRENGR